MSNAKPAEGFWKSVLKGRKILTDEEAKEMKSVIRELRRGYGFR